MPIQTAAFRNGDVYIDYPQEKVMFHYVFASKRVLRRYYRTTVEETVPFTSELFNEAIRLGEPVTAEQYAKGGRP